MPKPFQNRGICLHNRKTFPLIRIRSPASCEQNPSWVPKSRANPWRGLSKGSIATVPQFVDENPAYSAYRKSNVDPDLSTEVRRYLLGLPWRLRLPMGWTKFSNFEIIIILKFATKSVELIENWSFWCPNRQILCNKVRWHRGQAHEALEEIARKHPEWNILSGKKLERDEFLSVLRNTKLKKSYTLKFSIMSMNAVGR